MEGCVLKVTPETLTNVSADVLIKINKAQSAFQQLDSHIGKMSGHWVGDGHDKMRAAYNSHKDDYEQIFRALREHTNNLQLIASGYSASENKAEQIANALPADVIV